MRKKYIFPLHFLFYTSQRWRCNTKHAILLLSIFAMATETDLTAQNYFAKDHSETNLNSFSTISAQGHAVTPTNNILGANFYQGVNFGFDINNYTGLGNAVGTNELHFGRWNYDWKGWSKICLII